MADAKWSNDLFFSPVNTILSTDRIMGLRSGANIKALGVLASTSQVTGLDSALAACPTLSGSNTFTGSNTFSNSNTFNGINSFNAAVLVKEIQNPLVLNRTIYGPIGNGGTLSASDLVKGEIYCFPPSADDVWQFPTAVDIDAALGNISVNRGMLLRLFNQSTSHYCTFTSNTGVDFSLLSVANTLVLPPNSSVLLSLIKIDSGPSYVVTGQSYGSGSLPFEYYTHSTTWSGIWASPQASTCTILKTGNLINMQIPLVTATATTAAIITMNTALPTRFRPSADVHAFIPIQNNTAFSNLGGTKVLTTGVITVSASVSFGGNFTASGTGGIYGNVSLSWMV